MEFDCAKKKRQRITGWQSRPCSPPLNLGAVKLHFGRTKRGSVAQQTPFVAQQKKAPA